MFGLGHVRCTVESGVGVGVSDGLGSVDHR